MTIAERGVVDLFAATAAGRQTAGQAPRPLAQPTAAHHYQMGSPSRSSCGPCSCRRPGGDPKLLGPRLLHGKGRGLSAPCPK